MIARVCNFKVGICRGRNPGPVRTLDFDVECRDDAGINRVFVNFFEKNQASLGFVNHDGNSVAIFLPVSDFDLIHVLLASDDDVYVAWIPDAEGNLVWAEVTTSEHAIGPALHERKLAAV